MCYGNASVTGHIIPEKLSLTVRSGMDFSNDFRTQQKPQYTHAYLDGMYREQTIRSTSEINNDFLLNYHDTFGEFALNASFGRQQHGLQVPIIRLTAQQL